MPWATIAAATVAASRAGARRLRLQYEFDRHSASAAKVEAIEAYEPATHRPVPVVVE